VRLAGLHALERLAHNTPEQRQTIVDVICAYLCMPYTPPDEQPPPDDAATDEFDRYESRRQEKQVRVTAQNILARNLRGGVVKAVVFDRHGQRWWHRTPTPPAPAWPDIHLDLSGAVLLEFSLRQCQLYHADFLNAQFTGLADFTSA